MLAIIGGSGFSRLPILDTYHRKVVRTPYGEPSCPLTFGEIQGQKVVFIARHGYGHTFAPHEINYRANIWALAEQNITSIIALASVGSLNPDISVGELVLPHQLIDYTWGRAQTFFEGAQAPVVHIDFTEPYAPSLRHTLINTAAHLNIPLHTHATYAATQGPRLETAAEIQRLIRDGNDIVGMTGMPEAALAREKNIPYVTLAIVSNWAAGINTSQEFIDFSGAELQFKKGIHLAQNILLECTQTLSV